MGKNGRIGSSGSGPGWVQIQAAMVLHWKGILQGFAWPQSFLSR